MLYFGGMWPLLISYEAHTCKVRKFNGNDDEDKEGQGESDLRHIGFAPTYTVFIIMYSFFCFCVCDRILTKDMWQPLHLPSLWSIHHPKRAG